MLKNYYKPAWYTVSALPYQSNSSQKHMLKQGHSQRGGGPPIEMLFQVFRLNFSWNMPKMHYFRS